MKQDLKQRQIRAFFQIFGRKIKIFEQVKKPKCLKFSDKQLCNSAQCAKMKTERGVFHNMNFWLF